VFNADRIPVTGEVSLRVAAGVFHGGKSSCFFMKGLCVTLKSSVREIPLGRLVWYSTVKFGTCLNGSFVVKGSVLHHFFVFDPKEQQTLCFSQRCALYCPRAVFPWQFSFEFVFGTNAAFCLVCQ